VLEGKVIRRIARASLFIAFLMATINGCNEGNSTRTYPVAAEGNSRNGRDLVQAYGCGSCHIVPGVRGARGLVGPPLIYFGERTMIAGELPNTEDNLVRWIEHPRQIEPKTAMPELGVTDRDAHDIAAYLYTLRGAEGTQWMN
jgi:cytochrome c1